MKRFCLVFVFLLIYCLNTTMIAKGATKESMNLSTLTVLPKAGVKIEEDGKYEEVKYKNIDVSDNSGKSINLYKESEDIVEVFSQSNKKIFLSRGDIELMSQIVYAESKGEPYEGKVAVASVILNRVAHPSFPKSVKEVINQKNAFSCVKDGKIIATPDESCYNAVMDAIRGKDPTNNAVFFYNPKTATSKWMKNIDKANVKSIGNHVFFEINYLK
ncbi:cell wall hydrolase [Desnuesiella massiliensis]|uniref:cell wall hydrolase n=1 Tax=Desnuesiella massiliensis TaxID=1650662 RepID=UPI0009EB1BB3|nr:cell wall hydrolase [Desnuesiella massiliensis]